MTRVFSATAPLQIAQSRHVKYSLKKKKILRNSFIGTDCILFGRNISDSFILLRTATIVQSCQDALGAFGDNPPPQGFPPPESAGGGVET